MRIFYLMGKSSAGKDTIYAKLKETMPQLKTLVPYTTRPMREGEKNGREYFFVTDAEFEKAKEAGLVVESRTYQTAFGPWTYFTMDDHQVQKESDNAYLMIGTLQSYKNMREYYGSSVMVPIYVTVEDGERLKRAISREQKQKQPNYTELCRRFLADSVDFSEENQKAAGIKKEYNNIDLQKCLDQIRNDILKQIGEAKKEKNRESKEAIPRSQKTQRNL